MSAGMITLAMSRMNDEDKAILEKSFKRAFSTDEGSTVLKLLTQTISLATLPIGADDGACRDLNAQRTLVAEIFSLATGKGQ